MQDYSFLFPKSFNPGPRKKLGMIRRVLRSGVPQSLMLAAIMMIVEGARRR